MSISGTGKHDHHNQGEHHAHFLDSQQEDLKAHDSQIIIEKGESGNINVRLGFLQVKHVYTISFTIEDDLGEEVEFNRQERLHAFVESANPSADGKGHDIQLTFKAMKEKLMQESLTLCSKQNETQKVILNLNARVLGKGKGTPCLKKGIHFVRTESDGNDESETSDWVGFK